MTNQLPDGVYIGLPEDAPADDPDAPSYFGQRGRLGSTDVIKLEKQGDGWWWSSEHNPYHVDKETPERTAGSGLHAIFEGGLETYEARFVAAPDKAEFEPLAETIGDMKAALSEAGFGLSGTSAWNKDQWRGAMRLSLPDYPCWPNIIEAFEASVGDLRVLPAVEDRMLRLMYELALDPTRTDNVDVRALFDDKHPPLAEVSILWTEIVDDMPIKRRARLDRMYPDFDLDLKSLGNWGGRPLEHLTGDIIAQRGYDIQMADHEVAREAFRQFVAEGKVYGIVGSAVVHLDPADPLVPWLRTVAAVERWDYVWLFYQKPEPSGRAPVLYPVRDINDFPRSDPRVSGHIKRERALRFYVRRVREFGLDKPWARVAPVSYTNEDRRPRIFFPHWISADDGGGAPGDDYG